MNYNKDYYQILGVDKGASEEEIKKAYKKKAVQYHPDKNKGNKDSENKFKEINEAYQVLTKNKNEYDNRGFSNPFEGFSSNNPFGGFGGDFFNFMNPNDIFNAFSNRYRQTNFHQENLDINYNITISLEDVYNNRELNISYSRRESCPVCQGSGQDKTSGVKSKCNNCHAGKDAFGFACQSCGGTGKIYNNKCNMCKGKGMIDKQLSFTLNNTYKINQNTTKYLKGYGHHSKTIPGKVGILILNIKYDFDSKYRLTNKGLFKKLDLHYQDAIDGNPHEFKHLDGKKIKINIPKKTKDGDLIRLPNKGLLVNKTDRNDLIFEVNIIIDYEKLNAK
jgi:molecular chaperone DnaJ